MKQTLTRPDQLSSIKQAYYAIIELEARLENLGQAAREPIAVVGAGCRFPGGCNSPGEYWRFLKDRGDAIVEVPPDRWDLNEFYDSDPEKPGKMYTRYGGFLENIDRFDADFFGISPREARKMDPQQRLLAEVSWEALENSGIAADRLKGSRTGVYMGVSTHDYELCYFKSSKNPQVDAHFGLGTLQSINAGRLAFMLDLQGPVTQLDTACSSSLLAVHLACASLRAGECNLALAGGVNIMASPYPTIFFCKAKALAADGRCKTFDAAADGYTRGEGCGIVVLKRLKDAVAEGDPILALIQGSTVNHDGHSSGLTVPNGQAQRALLSEGLERVGVSPDQIDYVEAHGTGTPLGDPIEARALGLVYGAGRDPNRPLLLGSVKANIGHLEAAAGIAGLIKCLLAVKHGEIPGQINFNQPSPHIDWDGNHLAVSTSTQPWPDCPTRMAGVSAFGFSGTNVHILVKQAPERESARSASGEMPGLLTLSAKSAGALRELNQRYQLFLNRSSREDFADICFTSNRGRQHLPFRQAVAASDKQQAIADLKALAQAQPSTWEEPPTVAFLFSNTGHPPESGRRLYQTFAAFRKAADRCFEAAKARLPLASVDLYFNHPDPAAKRIGHLILLHGTAALWRSWGVEPTAVMGRGDGEIAAALEAGLFDVETAITLLLEKTTAPEAQPTASFSPAVIDLVSSLSGALDNGDMLRSALRAEPGTKPEKPARGLTTLAQRGSDVFIQIGPGTEWVTLCRTHFNSEDVLILPERSREGVGPNVLLDGLTQLYGRGLDIDWDGFSQGGRQLISGLPTYPFQRRRYWFRTDPSAALSSQKDHALLGTARAGSLKRLAFQAAVGAQQPTYLADHRIKGHAILPGAAFIETALAAAATALETDRIILENINLHHPLFLSASSPTVLHTQVTRHDLGNKVELTIKSTSGHAGGPDLLHCSCTVRALHHSPDVPPTPPSGKPLETEVYYSACRERGLDHGPAFLGITSLFAQEGGSSGTVLLPNQFGVENYLFHPALLDSCLQIFSAAFGPILTAGNMDGLFLPTGVEAFHHYRKAGTRLTCSATNISLLQGTPPRLQGDLTLFDQDQLVAELTGLTFSAVQPQILERLIQNIETSGGSPRPAVDLAKLRDQPQSRAGTIHRYVADLAGRILGREGESPALNQSLTEAGFDSLMMAELKNSVKRDLDVDLSLNDLAEDQRVVRVAQLILAAIEKDSPLPTPAGAPEEPGQRSAQIPKSHYQVASFPEYKNLENMIAAYEAEGLDFPYFKVCEGVNGAVSQIDGKSYINFSGYNYLGLSGSCSVNQAVEEAIRQHGTSVSASRPISGEIPIHGRLEGAIAQLVGVEDAIVYVGGHGTNVSSAGHLFGHGDLILHDSLIHNSLMEGAVRSGAKVVSFPHNDWREADRYLAADRDHYRRVLLAIEGVYSMDGDIPDLPAFIKLKQRRQCLLFVDEAHSMGVIGPGGRGIGAYYGIDPNDVDLWMGTLSKSFASCGGYIAGSHALVRYLKYTSPGFIYSVGISPANAAAALAAILELRRNPALAERLQARARLFLSLAKAHGLDTGGGKDSAVVPVIVGDSKRCLMLSQALFQQGINVQPMVYPAVPDETARLRFFIGADHEEAQIRSTVSAVARAWEHIRAAHPK